MTILAPKSVDYLSPRLESNNLLKESQLLEIGSKFITDPDDATLIPKVKSTGNVIQYLTGSLISIDDIKDGDIIASLPSGIIALDSWSQSGSSNTLNTWIEGTTDSTNNLKSTSSNGNINYVTVGNTGGEVLNSTDTENWTLVSALGTVNNQSIIWESFLFVLVGNNGQILTSPSGFGGTWASQTSGTSENLHGITHGVGTFVAVGDNQAIVTSSDGISWAVQTFTPSFTNFDSVTFGNSLFVLSGSGGGIATSPDGIVWTERTTPVSSILQAVTFASTNFGVSSDAYVACGNNGNIITSLDAINWTLQASGTTENLRAASANNGFYYVGGDDGVILASDDLSTWIADVNPAGTRSIRGMYRDSINETILAVGDDGMILTGISKDSITPFNVQISGNQIISRSVIKQNTRVNLDGIMFMTGFNDLF
jgi:hypothetical protein